MMRALTRARAARALVTVAAALAVWAIAALLTGGFRLEFLGMVVSSRNPVRPAIAAILLTAAAWRLDADRIFRSASRLIELSAGSIRRFLVPLAALFVLAAGIAFGGRAAIGADAFGYLSQSLLWLRHDLTIAQPFVALMPWPDADWTFSPLGYRPAEDHVLVPTYAPGLPLLMAGARLVSRCAPYYIVPLCGCVLVLFTGLLGRRVFGIQTGIAGAVMVAASPVVLMWTLGQMSDIPVATMWIAALLAADRRTLRDSIVAGALSGLAILIRPNLAPLALFPLLLALVDGGARRAVLERAVALVVALTPFVIVIGLVQNALYGSPLTSGYGALSSIYSFGNLSANLMRYPAWWWYAHGALGWLFVFGIFRPRPPQIRRRVLVLVGFSLAVALSYLFYLPFEHWGFLRFMLPALPIAMLLSADAIAWGFSRFGTVICVSALTAATALAVLHGVHRARWDGIFRNAGDDQRYADAGLYIASVTPARTIVLAMQHSGSVRYYSGRLTLRYDVLDPTWLDRALDRLEGLGFSTYALLEDWEEDVFRRRFSTQAAVRLLDGVPVAVRRSTGGRLRFFALRAPGLHPAGAEIPRTSRFDCIEPSPQFAMPPPGFTTSSRSD